MASSFLEKTGRVATVYRIKEILLFLLIFVRQCFGIIRIIHKVARTTDKRTVRLLDSVHVPDNFIFPTTIFRTLSKDSVI